MNLYSKRKFIRVDVVQQARLDFQDIGYDPCRIKNLSLTGMFVFGSFKQQVGDECIIRYSQTCSSSHFYFKAIAKVVRIMNDGLAIEFSSMPLDSYMLLQTTLLYEAVDPLAIGLELPENCPFEITIEISKEPEVNGSSKSPLPIAPEKKSG